MQGSVQIHAALSKRTAHPRFALPTINDDLLTIPSRRAAGATGMTMIELGIVMGIVAVLLALVLGLSRHIDTVVRIRRAQADLGEWQEALCRWQLQFGEYPFGAIDANGNETPPLARDTPLMSLSNLLSQASVQMALNNGATTNITLRAFISADISPIDPWGTPYIYACHDSHQSYTLFSCGPDRKSTGIPSGTAPIPDPALDDIHFER